MALAGLPETAKVPYPVVLSSKRGILRGQLIQDDVDGQHQEHQDHAEHQQPLRKCTSWSNLVHLPTRTEHTASTWGKVVNKMNLNSANCAFLSNLICQEKQNITGNIQNTLYTRKHNWQCTEHTVNQETQLAMYRTHCKPGNITGNVQNTL